MNERDLSVAATFAAALVLVGVAALSMHAGAYRFTGPRYLSSQSRLSRMNSLRGGA
jgi:hypothetical protein